MQYSARSLSERRRHVFQLVVYCLLVAIAGCGSSLESTVSGTVTYASKPVPNAIVSFQGKSGGPGAYAMTNEAGEYSLRTGEVFVDLGIAIKTASPFKTTLVIELTNDGPGYIPTRRAFAEGSYETVNSRVKPGGGEMLVETAIELLTDLADDAP